MAGNLRTIKDIRNYLSGELSGIYPEGEVKSITGIILEYIFKKDKLYLLSGGDEEISPDRIKSVIRISGELKRGKPVQYITGETVFYGCRIMVGEGVLIPRPETEELVDLIIKENRGYRGNILDIGTGSGCIAIALAINLPGSAVSAMDISGRAVDKAAENARINNVKIRLLKGDIREKAAAGGEKAGIIVSNPPYVRNSEKKEMHKNILDFEPPEALFVPDNDPLLFYHAILEAAENILLPSGIVYFEINEAMVEHVSVLLESYGFSGVKILKDINNKDRFAKGNKNG